MDKSIRIQVVGLPERDLLTEMYDQFNPLGETFGLPPRRAEARKVWVGAAVGHDMNLAAFSPAGRVVGHCFLVPDSPGSAELALFVHQDFRRRGIGAGLINAGLELAGAAGLRRVWTLTSFQQQVRCAPASQVRLPPDRSRFYRDETGVRCAAPFQEAIGTNCNGIVKAYGAGRFKRGGAVAESVMARVTGLSSSGDTADSIDRPSVTVHSTISAMVPRPIGIRMVCRGPWHVSGLVTARSC